MRMTIAAVGVAVLSMALSGWFWSAQAQKAEGIPQTKICTLKVAGMVCAGCEVAVKMAAKKVDGVTDAKASHETGTAEITYDPAKTNPEAIAKAITEHSGYEAEATNAGR